MTQLKVQSWSLFKFSTENLKRLLASLIIMNEMKATLTLLSLFFYISVCAQGDYMVKTTKQTATSGTEEEQFVISNFPYYTICDWKAGQKFMLVIEDKYGFMPIFKSATNNREVNNDKLQYKVFELLGMEEVTKTNYSGSTSTTRLLFESEGEKYYYETKNQSLGEICASNSRALIHNLVFLTDVDVARELLQGKTLYTKVTSARIDDGNISSGSREVKIPRNLEVTVTGVGAGTRECPVKIVFEDRDGNSYFRNVMFSKTNSGLLDSDMVGGNMDKYFPNVFSFVDKEIKTTEDIRSKYVGRSVYPKHIIEARKEGGGLQALLRYTPLKIKDMTLTPSSTMATLKVTDKNNAIYNIEVNLKYDVFLRNEDYIDDMFGYGDLRKMYPGISEDNWLLLGNGEVKTGMTKDECQLALGSPIRMDVKTTSRYETWYYQGRTIEFEDNRITRIK